MSAINQSINQSLGSVNSVNHSQGSMNHGFVLNESSDGYLTPNPVSSHSSQQRLGAQSSHSSKNKARNNHSKTFHLSRDENKPSHHPIDARNGLINKSAKSDKKPNQTRDYIPEEPREEFRNPPVSNNPNQQNPNQISPYQLKQNVLRESFRTSHTSDNQLDQPKGQRMQKSSRR